MSARRLFLAALVIAVALGVRAWRWASAEPEVGARVEERTLTPIPRPAQPAAARRPAPSPSRPRSSPADPVEAARAGDVESPTGAADPDTGTPPGGGVVAAVPATGETLKATLDAIRPDIVACVSDWAPLLDAYAGRLVLRIQLGPDGVTDAAVLDVTDIPAPVLSCFGAAVYTVDWPVPEAPIEITAPFEVDSSPEGAEVPGEDGGALDDKR